jgi:phosphonate transport system ATP-binding protein
MQAGRVVFDGPPEALDAARVRDIYGITEAEFAAEAAARAAAAQPRPAMA